MPGPSSTALTARALDQKASPWSPWLVLAYIVSLAATLYWYRQVSGGGVWDALIVRPSDRHFYSELWHKLRARALPSDKKAP